MSGAPLPTSEIFAEILAEEIVAFSTECCKGELTLEEILEAIRFNSIEDLKYPSGEYVNRPAFKGSCFHLSFLGHIVYNYSTLRESLDRKLQNFLDGYE